MATKIREHDVTDIGLAGAGERRITWAAREMPVLAKIAARFTKERPLSGLRIGARLHVTAETANLKITRGDGPALVTDPHTKRRELLADVRGGTEETTTGVTRLRAMATEGV